MSDTVTVEDRVLDHIDELIEFVKGAVDPVSSEVAELANEIIIFGVASNAIFAMIFLVLSCFLLKKSYRWLSNSIHGVYLTYDKKELFGILGVWGIFVGSLSSIFTLHFVENFVMAILAPRLFLLDYLKGLVG